MANPTPALSDEIWQTRVVPFIQTDENGCWNWVRTKTQAGYGQVRIFNTALYTHRLAYVKFTGEISDGLLLDHLCRNRACCNPKHLEAVTQWVNVMRGESDAASKARQTHCVNGHEFDEKNTYILRNGRRRCRPCVNNRRRKTVAV